MNSRTGLRAAVVAVSSLVAAVAVTVNLPASAAGGTVTVTAGSPQTNDATYMFAFTTSDSFLASPAPAPSVTLTRHDDTTDTITGTDVTLEDGGQTSTHLVASFDLNHANPGDYDVEVTQGTLDDTCTWSTTEPTNDCVDIVAPAPTIDPQGVSPATLAVGTTGGSTTLTIAGSGFTKGPYTQCDTGCTGPRVEAYRHDTGEADGHVTLSASPTTPPGTITMPVTVAGPIAAAYTDDVVVDNGDGKVARCSQCLTIQPQPTIGSIVLQATGGSTIGLGATDETLVVTGDHLPPEPMVTFTPPDTTKPGDISGFTTTGPVPDGDGHQTLTLTDVDTTDARQVGQWQVTVASADWRTTSAPFGFEVDVPPTANAVHYDDATVSDYGQGAHQVGLTLDVDPSTVDADHPLSHPTLRIVGAPGITVSDVTSATGTNGDPDTVQATLDIPVGTPTGDYGLQLVNPDGGVAACDNSTAGPVPPATANSCLLTVASAPNVATLDPSTVTGGFDGPVTIQGGSFHTGTNVHVRIGTDKPFVDTDVTPDSTSQITVPAGEVSVPDGQTASDWPVTVTNKDDHGTDVATDKFHVANLSVTGVEPATETNDTAYELTISGTHLASDAAVSLVGDGVPAIPGTWVSGSDTSLKERFDLQDKDPGFYDVKVVNPPGDSNPGTATCDGCFQLLAPAPTISSVTPDTLGGGATRVGVTIDGTHFYPSAKVAFDDADVDVVPGSVHVDSTGSIVLSVDVAPHAAGDSGTVSVTNTDGKTVSSAFTVDPAPTVTGITPDSHAGNGQAFTLTVSGSGFSTSSPPSLQFSEGSVSASGYTVSSGGDRLTAQVAIPPSVVTGGPVDLQVTVVNADHGRASSPADLRAFTVPTQPRAVFASGGVRNVNVTWQTPASDGGDPAGISSYTVVLTRHGESSPVASFTTPDAATLQHTFNGLANGATYDVRVRATDHAGDSPSAPASATTYDVPGRPQDLTVTPQDRSLDVSWSAPAGDGGTPVTSYTATVAPHAGTSSISSTTPDAATTKHTFIGLTNGALYDVTVTATNAAGTGPAATGSATPRTVPAAPTGVRAFGGDGKATVHWSPPTSNGGSPVRGYTVTGSPGDIRVETGADATTAPVTGLSNGTTYSFAVTAHNAAGSGASATATATPRFATALSLHHSRKRVIARHVLRLSGVLSRSNHTGVTGALIRVYRKSDHGYVGRVAAVRTDSTGHWALRLEPMHNARYSAWFSGDGADLGSSSVWKRTNVAPLVTIGRPATRWSTSHVGRRLVIRGWVSPNKHGRVVRLYHLDRSGHPHLLRRTTLSRHSIYRFAVPLHRGIWRLRVVVGRTPGNVAGRSTIVHVRRV